MQKLKAILRFLIILFLAFGFDYSYWKYRDIYSRYQDIKKAEKQFQSLIEQIHGLVAQKSLLEKEIERLKADQLRQEESVRKNKGWVYPGEKILRLEEQ